MNTIATDRSQSPFKAGAQIGQVLSGRGSEAQIALSAPWPDDDARPTVGKFMVIDAGKVQLIGMITEVEARGPGGPQDLNYKAVAKIALMGEITTNVSGKPHFKRGVSGYPSIGDAAHLITGEQLRLIYSPTDLRTINIGQINHDSSINALVDVDNLISKHFAILGSTGVGKSSGVAVILSEIIRVRPDIRLFLLDGHNEYGDCFGEKANVINPHSFKLPFWIFNFEELTDVIYGGRPAVAEEVEILSELIPIAKAKYLGYKTSSSRLGIRKIDPKRSGFTVDTPVPYLLQDLLSLIDNRMGKLENRSSRMNYHRLTTRLETITNDPRYAFMFENVSVGGDTMVDLLSDLFRLAPDGRPISIMQMAGLPVEVMDAFVCVLCRLAFEFGLWSDGAMPLLFVCEEAHRYASANPSVGFGPTRRALARIAKEGRKHGVFLGLVTQRPAELDPTIISQCSTLFAMRMANDQDQSLLRSAVADAAANLLDFVPSLGTGEVVGFGEGMPIPARLSFTKLDSSLVPRSESATPSLRGEKDVLMNQDFIKSVVDRWRGATEKASEPGDGEASMLSSSPMRLPPKERNSTLLSDVRRQVLKRQW